MAHCFCGCGRKVPLSRRLLNLRGRLVVERLDIVEQRLGRDADAPAIQEWYAAGDAFAAGLARSVHRESLERRAIKAHDITAWQRYGRQLEQQHRKAEPEMGMPARRHMKELDMTPEQYLEALGRGEIDP